MPGARRSVGFAHRTVVSAAFLINDTFTAVNGTAPSTLYWGTPAASTGSGVIINTNQLRMVDGTLGSYADYQYLSSAVSAADFDFNIDVILAASTTEHFPQVGFRGSGVQESQVTEQTEQTTGYFVDFDVLGNLLILRRRTGGVNTTLGSTAVDWADNDVAHLRIFAVGSSIQVGCTRNAAAPPTTYLITVTDATYASGRFWLGHAGGNDTVSDIVRFDNAVVTVPSSNVAGTLARTTGAVTATTVGTVGSGGTGTTFAAYQTAVLAERRGYALFGNVTGGQGAVTPTIVTNTNNSGAGSLRDALTGGSNRWVIFDRAVFPKTTETTINLTSTIDMRNNNNITVDGYGARVRITGFGITTAQFTGPPSGAINVSNNLCFINLKMTNITLGDAWDCLTVDGTDRAWFHHLDLSQGGDGNLDITNIFAGPNPFGYMTISNCYIHDSKTGKGCLIADQSGPDASQPNGWGDYQQASSSYPGGNGGDNRITIVDSRFRDTLRNPVVSNYWVHFFNNYVHNWVLEGTALWGFNGALRAENNVLNGIGAGGNASKGLYAETFGYADHSRDYKRWANSGNAFLNGATEVDASGGFLNPPIGTIFTVPYSYSAETVTGDAGAALIARLTSATLSTAGRAGCIDRNGYYDVVGASLPFDYTVGVDGTLQTILSQSTATLTNKRVRVPAGVWATDNSGASIYFVNKDFGNVTVVLEAGATLRGPVSGVEMYGAIRNIHFEGPGTVEGNGTQTFSEGFIIDATRTDKGAAAGAVCGNISLDGITVTSQSGTGPLQRNGIAIWGGDLITVKNCTVHDAGSNAFAGFGSAGSGISIGVGRRLTGVAGSPRVLIDSNHVYNILEVQDGVSADRNGIILDIYHGSFAKYSDYLIGDVVVSNNNIHDVSGRGIQDLCGGLSDSLITITGNAISGQWARRLGGSAPEAAIGGYGAGTCGNVVCSSNTVTFDSGNGGKPAFLFISFDGDGPGVFGSNNHVIGSGTAIAWESSRTNTPPSGFVT